MVLEMIGDLLEVEVKLPTIVLFVCKLRPLIEEEDLDVLHGWFGKVTFAHIIRDLKIENSLRYAFLEFLTKKLCEDAKETGHTTRINDRKCMWTSMKVSRIYGNNIKRDRDLEAM
jgi:peptidyl-prolyl cis-trans isomerase-like 4